MPDEHRGPVSHAAAPALAFAEFELDLTRRRLTAGTREIALRPKSFDVLRVLAENAGRLVDKEQLLREVWPDVIVGDESIARCVSDIRAALGDSDQRIVKTLPRRGYQLAVDVEAVPAGPSHEAYPPSAVTESPGLFGKARALAAATVMLALVVAVALVASRPSTPPVSRPPAVAVLSFADLGPDPAGDHLTIGLPDDIASALGRYGAVHVIARRSASNPLVAGVDWREAGRVLGADYVLAGTVRRDGEHLRVAADLLDVTTGLQRWAERYDSGNAFAAVQDEIAQKILYGLVAGVSLAETEEVGQRRTTNLGAYEVTLQGLQQLRTLRGEHRGADLVAAKASFERALAADPLHAPALRGLAEANLAIWLEPSPDDPIGHQFQAAETLAAAESAARAAVHADPRDAEAYATLGWVLYWSHHMDEAVAALDRAIQLNPNLVDGRVAIVLAHGGQADKALAYMERVMALDPLYPPNFPYYRGKALFFLGRYEEAIRLIRPAVAQMPGNRPPLVLLAAVAAHLDQMDVAREAASEILRLQPDFTISGWLDFLRLSEPTYVGRLVDGLRKAGLPA